MLYVLAAIGALTVIVLLWRTLDPRREVLTGARHHRAVLPPDDNPEFLRQLGEQQRGQRGEDGESWPS